MVVVKVLGGGCAKCQATYKQLSEITTEKGVDVLIEKVEDMQKIITYDVMSTPAVVINGSVVHQGSVPPSAVVKGWFL